MESYKLKFELLESDFKSLQLYLVKLWLYAGFKQLLKQFEQKNLANV